MPRKDRERRTALLGAPGRAHQCSRGPAIRAIDAPIRNPRTGMVGRTAILTERSDGVIWTACWSYQVAESRAGCRSPTPRSGASSMRCVWKTGRMRPRTFNVGQRAVAIVGFGAGLLFFGRWLTARGEGKPGWVAYAPLSRAANTSELLGPGLHPWVRLVIWLALVAVWVVVGVVFLRSRRAEDSSGPAD